MRAYIYEGKKTGNFRTLKFRLREFSNTIWEEIVLWYSFEYLLLKRGELKIKEDDRDLAIPESINKMIDAIAAIDNERLLVTRFIIAAKIDKEAKKLLGILLLPKEIREQWYE